LVDGAKRWYEDRLLDLPSAVQNATSSFFNEMDDVKEFINMKCKMSKTMKVKTVELYAAFRTWWISEGKETRELITKKEFATRLEKMGIARKRSNGYYFIGIDLTQN
jgi:phage/plasmid-associated DNA primase